MPGEHDASLDGGEAYKEFFGELNYTFDHKGVHFIALDNVSDPGAIIGDEAARLAAARPHAARPERAHRRADASAAVRSVPAMGLGDT